MEEDKFNRLTLIGGSDYKKLVRRCLQFLMTDKLGILCSWTGQKDNFRVKDLQLIETLKRAAKASFGKMTDKDFALVVSDWFRFSKQRNQRKAPTE